MADVTVDKKSKLASTRKRFKELQELKKKRNESIGRSKPPDQLPAEDVGFRHSHSNNHLIQQTSVQSETEVTNDNISISDNAYSEQIEIENSENVVLVQPQNDLDSSQVIDITNYEKSALPNYFGSSEPQSSAAFFDDISDPKISESVQNEENPSLLTYFNTLQENTNQQRETENIGLPRYFDNMNISDTIWENTVPEDTNIRKDEYKLFPGEDKVDNTVDKTALKEEDVVCQDYSEIKQNEISEYAKENSEHLDLGPFPIAHHYENSIDNIISPNDNQKLMDYLGTTGATEEEKSDICHTNQEIDDSTDLTKKEIQHSSNVESLRQLSDQLAQMIEPNYEYSSSGSITDLEKRNIELAASLEREKISNEQLQAANVELRSRITQLETELTYKKIEPNLQNTQEVMQLKHELQTHLQTIGLLVAEKTELASNVSQYEINFKQKTAECEELQARLKASRSRVADLERELNNLKIEKSKTDDINKQYSTSVETLRHEYKVLKDQKDELAQDLLEVREKLKNTLEENVQLQQDIKEIAGKLSLAEIKIQQLSFGGVVGVDTQVEQLTEEKFSLESDVANLNHMLKSVIKERDESTIQYQQYAQQLNAQISNLSSKLEQLQLEKENYVIQDQNRIKHIETLERQLQDLQNDQMTFATRNLNYPDLKSELEKSREMCVQLQIEKTALEGNYTKVSNEKDLLFKELEAKTDSISQLESMVEQLRGNQPDSVKLLATMESDKVAASRAIQQNKELKQQLESVQEVFMKMDSDKVVLTENLKAQQQTNKELIEKLQKTEITLQSLADAIEIKDKELTHLREVCEDMNRQAIHHEQLEDRLRHYEAHDHSAHILQKELQEAKLTIAKLEEELHMKKNETTSEKDNSLEDARQTILELTNEINKLKTASENVTKDGMIESQEKNENPKTQVVEVENNKGLTDIDRNDNIIDKENAMKYLEEKVKRTMQEIADLTDEKQRLEHIVLQLQGETETIGEYVALYQHQRMVLKQKAMEKDLQLKQLASDREQIKIKLDRLNELIRKLVTDKGALPAELLQHQENMNSQISNFCAEHSKMNEEINKIKHTNIIEPENVADDERTSQTAEEIISLLSEIKSSNLVQPDENFHHCPWCSGQLMTV